MFIAVVGTRFSGKSTIQEYLILKGFTPVTLGSVPSEQDDELPDSADDASDFFDDDGDSNSSPTVNANNINADARPVLQGVRSTDKVESRSSFLFLTPSSAPSPVSTRFPDQFKRKPLHFSSPLELLDYTTLNWNSHFVTVDLNVADAVERFVKRPWFMLVSVDAPLLVRYRRSYESLNGNVLTFEDFVYEHDALFYGESPRKKQGNEKIEEVKSSIHGLNKFVTLRVINHFDSVQALHSYLDDLDLLNPDRLRPSWDTYFMTLASLASMRSNCMKRRVGAILVRNNRIVATGYNGTPRGLKNCNEGGCARCNGTSTLKEDCLCLHAEENALLEAGRDRIGDGAVLYCNTCPCLTCTVKIVQTGVKEVVYSLSYKVDEASAKIFKEAGVQLRRHAPP